MTDVHQEETRSLLPGKYSAAGMQCTYVPSIDVTNLGSISIAGGDWCSVSAIESTDAGWKVVVIGRGDRQMTFDLVSIS